MIDETFVEAITANAKTEVLATTEGEFFTKPVLRAPLPPQPDTLMFATLDAVVQFTNLMAPGFQPNLVNDGRGDDHLIMPLRPDLCGGEVFAITVDSPTTVSVWGKYDEWGRRPKFALASPVIPQFHRSGQQVSTEEMLIALHANVVATQSRDDTILLLGSIKTESSQRLQDDGLTQKTVIKQGIDLAVGVKIENPRVLRPYRTFPEIEQPESPFILRLHAQEGKLPTVSLTLADGGFWQLQAMKDIRAYLKERTKVTVL